MPGYHIDRITEDIKREIVAILRELKDPRISGMLTVVKVSVTNDLSYAKVYVSAMEGMEAAKASVKGLTAAQGYIRHELGRRLHLRKCPELRFIADDSIEKGFALWDKLKELDPDHKALVNLLGVPPCTDTDHYEIYLRRFVEEFDPEIISYDHYNLQFKEVDRLTDKPEAIVSESCRAANGWQDKVFEKYNRYMFMDNLEVVRQVAAEKNLPWKIIVQVVEHWNFRYLTESEIRWGVFNALAYGPMEIDYFTYCTPPGRAEGWDYHHALINLDGTKDSHYYMVQRINKDLALLGAEIMDAKSEEVLHIGIEPGDKRVRYFFESYGSISNVDAKALVLGFFDNGKIILSNKDMEMPQHISFAFEGTPKHLNKVSGQWEDMVKADDGRYHLCLAAGDGEMIK